MADFKKGDKVKASKDEPQYLVRSEKSESTAVHKPDALGRAGGALAGARPGGRRG